MASSAAPEGDGFFSQRKSNAELRREQSQREYAEYVHQQAKAKLRPENYPAGHPESSHSRATAPVSINDSYSSSSSAVSNYDNDARSEKQRKQEEYRRELERQMAERQAREPAHGGRARGMMQSNHNNYNSNVGSAPPQLQAQLQAQPQPQQLQQQQQQRDIYPARGAEAAASGSSYPSAYSYSVDARDNYSSGPEQPPQQQQQPQASPAPSAASAAPSAAVDPAREWRRQQAEENKRILEAQIREKRERLAQERQRDRGGPASSAPASAAPVTVPPPAPVAFQQQQQLPPPQQQQPYYNQYDQQYDSLYPSSSSSSSPYPPLDTYSSYTASVPRPNHMHPIDLRAGPALSSAPPPVLAPFEVPGLGPSAGIGMGLGMGMAGPMMGGGFGGAGPSSGYGSALAALAYRPPMALPSLSAYQQQPGAYGSGDDGGGLREKLRGQLDAGGYGSAMGMPPSSYNVQTSYQSLAPPSSQQQQPYQQQQPQQQQQQQPGYQQQGGRRRRQGAEDAGIGFALGGGEGGAGGGIHASLTQDQADSKRTAAMRYREELEAQARRDKERKQQELESKKANDVQALKMLEGYNPWGKGGGGAPFRDANGDIITNPKVIAKLGKDRPPSQGAPSSQPMNGYGYGAAASASSSSSYSNPVGSAAAPAAAVSTSVTGGGRRGAAVPEHMRNEVEEKRSRFLREQEALREQMEASKRMKEEAKRRKLQEDREDEERVERERQKLADRYSHELRKEAEAADDKDDKASKGKKGAAPAARAPPQQQQQQQQQQQHQQQQQQSSSSSSSSMSNDTMEEPPPGLDAAGKRKWMRLQAARQQRQHDAETGYVPPERVSSDDIDDRPTGNNPPPVKKAPAPASIPPVAAAAAPAARPPSGQASQQQQQQHPQQYGGDGLHMNMNMGVGMGMAMGYPAQRPGSAGRQGPPFGPGAGGGDGFVSMGGAGSMPWLGRGPSHVDISAEMAELRAEIKSNQDALRRKLQAQLNNNNQQQQQQQQGQDGSGMQYNTGGHGYIPGWSVPPSSVPPSHQQHRPSSASRNGHNPLASAGAGALVSYPYIRNGSHGSHGNHGPDGYYGAPRPGSGSKFGNLPIDQQQREPWSQFDSLDDISRGMSDNNNGALRVGSGGRPPSASRMMVNAQSHGALHSGSVQLPLPPSNASLPSAPFSSSSSSLSARHSLRTPLHAVGERGTLPQESTMVSLDEANDTATWTQLFEGVPPSSLPPASARGAASSSSSSTSTSAAAGTASSSGSIAKPRAQWGQEHVLPTVEPSLSARGREASFTSESSLLFPGASSLASSTSSASSASTSTSLSAGSSSARGSAKSKKSSSLYDVNERGAKGITESDAEDDDAEEKASAALLQTFLKQKKA